MRVLTGTSGFSYSAWRGSFYPPGLPAARMLHHYASQFPSVEINATFYRVPHPVQLAGWRAQVPPGFVFALKAPQRVSHAPRPTEAAATLARLYQAASELGHQLGPVLFQLPPSASKDLGRLEELLSMVPAGGRTAFEFRHASWFSDDVLRVLHAHGAALCVAEAEGLTTPLVPTAGWGYLRLRKEWYGPDELRAWADRLRAQPWTEAFVFFMHEDEGRGPFFAAALAELLGTSAAHSQSGDSPG
jgi:uncharacterized protein YecE (DUF72 family)